MPEGFYEIPLCINPAHGINGALFIGSYNNAPLLIFAIRGSDFSFADWVRNLHSHPVKIPWRCVTDNASLHHGYLKAALLVINNVLSDCRQYLQIPNTRILLAGSSAAGGIIEGLADYFLTRHKISPGRISGYTFGSPPIVGRSGLHSVADYRRFRVFTKTDIVPLAALPLIGCVQPPMASASGLNDYIADAYMLDKERRTMRAVSRRSAIAGNIAGVFGNPVASLRRVMANGFVSHRMDTQRDIIFSLSREG
jgi:hypothetical protein